MTGIVPDRFDTGGYLKLFLIRHRSQLRENFPRVIRCVEWFLRRFARAQAFAILPLGIGNLQAGGGAPGANPPFVRRPGGAEGAPDVPYPRDPRRAPRVPQFSG